MKYPALEKNHSHAYLFILRQALRDAHKMIAEYEDECASYSRQGYRPHYCVHGTNQWTDYDNICGGCEDGIFSAGQFALIWADQRDSEYQTAYDAYMYLVKCHAPESVQQPAMEWLYGLMDKYAGKGKHRPLAKI